MQQLVGDAIAAGADVIDPDALDQHVWLYRSAGHIDLTSAAAC